MRTPVLLATTVLALTAVPAGSAFAGQPEDPSTVHGAAISSLPDDERRLSVQARTAPSGETTGRVSFSHESPNGLSRFTAALDCLAIGPDGTVQVSGTIAQGSTAAGVVLDDKPVAFTLRTSGAQTFSLPRIGESVTACGGGRPEQVPVSKAGFTVR